MIFSYFNGLFRSRFYLALLLVSVGIGLKIPDFNLDSAPYVLILVIGFIWVSAPIVDPRKVLGINDFLLNLPLVRERLSFLMALALLPLTVPLFLKSEGILVVFLTLLSILISTFLIFDSVFAGLMLPLAFVFPFLHCVSLKLASLVALTGPYLIWAIKTISKRLAFRTSFRGFLIDGRYAILLSLLVFVFDIFYEGEMKFVVADYIGFKDPDFNPVLFIAFISLSLAFITIPYFTSYGLREGDLYTSHIRAIVGTPIRRRATAFLLALVPELPVLAYLNLLEHFAVSPGNALKIVGAGAFFNSVVPTGNNSKWTSYSFVAYMVAVHFLIKVPAWQSLAVFFVLSIVLYDIDVWRCVR
ncbi:hypothetical protein [Thermococcus thioreducens]|uniref:Uncharacterized protein n=1 Tax=Thermococcus thioreducens TaxID=277988 RepID=A0A0Q2RFZ9_9EURY|nr:hypothetical protein [Thermococcus thioreducens]ASJ12201.1 hypothetical protein A3L14_04560 [Thermococcus thioreducens]KQH82942.1 hypothetical protein AMR53_01555 [Thermococcus thioreducens]SEV95003.1 hypothetical protein SAMN05216170_1055 [Thermococcus thioreducens]